MGVSERLAYRRGVTAAVVAVCLAALSGCGTGAKNDTFDLSAAAIEASSSARSRQLLVPDPTALKVLDSEQVVVRLSGSEVQYLSGAQWSDSLPKVVQAKLVETFENTGRLGGVGKPGQGLAIDYQLVTDIRAFEIDTNGADRAIVEISVKLLNDRNGTVKAQQVFRATVPASGTQNPAYIAALDRAFGQVSAQIVSWTLSNI
ncbi:membrane integrity-associated transporter subunit PqiC [Ciceribacter sp. L1K23]|uniref:ABC-type transport auxiliary lipoprotein family protein n=1 Tax=Ciceribacter sp. L1K23 TaxID=2820276 RepID=UPI001B81BC40|nr:ABC-type transport auxiliary lipoprotein family protein [Ciceribacter sp. L1K23]MBR0555268.1 membrane integrity-associated transporter subunit PqiC [Ciceribacter sp. L1K23]